MIPCLDLRRAFKKVLLLFYLLLFIAPAGMADQQRVNTQTVEPAQGAFAYIISPQNVLQIKIFGDASTNQIYRVDERGYIKHALLGPIKIGGMSVSEAEKFIESKLVGDYFVDPRVTIFMLEQSHFSVLGEVKKPGTYEILGKVSVIEAISMAGGFTPVAAQRDVKIIRKQEGRESTINVDSTRITQQGDTSANIDIQADDVVVVPKSFF